MANLQISKQEMLNRIARFKDLVPSEYAFVDSKISLVLRCSVLCFFSVALSAGAVPVREKRNQLLRTAWWMVQSAANWSPVN